MLHEFSLSVWQQCLYIISNKSKSQIRAIAWREISVVQLKGYLQTNIHSVQDILLLYANRNNWNKNKRLQIKLCPIIPNVQVWHSTKSRDRFAWKKRKTNVFALFLCSVFFMHGVIQILSKTYTDLLLCTFNTSEMRCVFSLWKTKQTNCIFAVNVDSVPNKELSCSLAHMCEKVDIIKMFIKTKLFFCDKFEFAFLLCRKEEVK